MTPHRQHQARHKTGNTLYPIVALLLTAILALTACAAQTGSNLGAQGAIPPIDLDAPQRTETATFALG